MPNMLQINISNVVLVLQFDRESDTHRLFVEMVHLVFVQNQISGILFDSKHLLTSNVIKQDGKAFPIKAKTASII